MDLFVPLELDWLFLFHVGEIFNYNLLKKNSSYAFFFSSSGTPIILMLVWLILSQRSLRLSVLFILFTLFCSSELISTILSSIPLVHFSTSDILLLTPSRVFFREGNGNPLHYSCLENPMDGGAWWAAVYGVTQSRTRLKWLSYSRRREKERVWENFWRDYSWKFPQRGKGNS